MSEEKKLLLKWVRRYIAREGLNDSYRESISLADVYIETLSLLAQPEQEQEQEQEQEPVAWMYEWDSPTTGQLTCRYVNMGKDKPNVEANFLARNFTPLYTSPPKRDPLSEATIECYLERLGSNFKWDDGFEAGVKWAEKAHGIGK